MRRRSLVLAVLLTAWSSPGVRAQEHQPVPVTVRVLTYNIRHGEGRDGLIDLERTAAVIRQARPDLVALQEVDRRTERVDWVDQLAELARLTGMHAEFGHALDFAGGEYGVAVLSRWPLEEAENHALPSTDHREPRTALTVQVRVGEAGPLVRFTSTHLDSGRDSDRLAQAAYLADHLAALPDDGEALPAILAGDFNDRVGTEVMAPFDARWTNAASAFPEEPTGRRRRGPRGDHVLFGPTGSWQLVEAEVIDETTASDHRPILAVLAWQGRR